MYCEKIKELWFDILLFDSIRSIRGRAPSPSYYVVAGPWIIAATRLDDKKRIGIVLLTMYL